MKTTYAWFAKPNSGEYRKIQRTAHEQERDCFTLYAGITERSTDERFSGGYKFRYHNLLDRDLDYPEGGKYVIRKREINLVSRFNVPDSVPESFKEQLYINAVREAADYLKKHNIKAKVGNISNPVGDHRDVLFEDWCDDYNGGCYYDKEVYDKIIKEVKAYHEEAYLKSDKQNSYDAQLRETYKEAAAEICDAAQRALKLTGSSLDKVDELLKENEKLKEENKQLNRKNELYLESCSELLGKALDRMDEEQVLEFAKNDYGPWVIEKRNERTREILLESI